jgi:hypothetical protein
VRIRHKCGGENGTNKLYISGTNFTGSTITVTILVDGVERIYLGTFYRINDFSARAIISLDQLSL